MLEEMVVELALPAMLPDALVALHAVQLSRPRLGSGMGGRRAPWNRRRCAARRWGNAWGWIALWLSVALVAHLIDLRRRWRRSAIRRP
jgi:hypothetical protein